jgi:hypothetical protein
LSRLDSAIRRLLAQRACLKAAAAMIAELPGPVLELGLGNGRTYDHLRELLPDREIFAFDLQIAAHPSCIPDPDHLILGDLRQTLKHSAARLRGRVALAHADIGTGDEVENARLAAAISAPLGALIAPGGVIAADRVLAVPGSVALALPPEVSPDRYFMYRMAAP